MGGIGVAELLIVGVVVLMGGAVVIGVIAAVVMALRAANGPKTCPHCGKALR